MIEPRHNRVLVQRIETEQQVGSIIVPDSAKSETMICKVLAVGPGRWVDGEFYKTAVKPGDIVLVPGIGAQSPDYDMGDGKILIEDADIGAILDGVPEKQYKPPLTYV